MTDSSVPRNWEKRSAFKIAPEVAGI